MIAFVRLTDQFGNEVVIRADLVTSISRDAYYSDRSVVLIGPSDVKVILGKPVVVAAQIADKIQRLQRESDQPRIKTWLSAFRHWRRSRRETRE